jgi:uncharacterized protein YjbI with pentapeptide repeats
MDDVNDLSRAALSTINQNSSLDDLDKVSSIAKAAAEAKKADLETKNAGRILSIEFWKTLTGIFIPIASLLTVVATVYIQSRQLMLTSHQIEDTQWRDFLDSIRKTQNVAISDVTFVPRLKSFLRSETYGLQATDVGKRLMGNLTDKPSFDDLFDTLFPHGANFTLADITDILKNLHRTDLSIEAACNPIDPTLHIPSEFNPWGYCVNIITDEQALGFLKNYAGREAVMQARKNGSATESEEKRLYGTVASLLKERADKSEVDLTDLVFDGGDFSSVDFSLSDLSGSQFNACNLSMAQVTPIASLNTNFNTSNWWDARTISRPILEKLITDSFPGNYKGEVLHVLKGFNQEYYSEQVKRLCRADGFDCSTSSIPYNRDYFTAKEDW